MLIFFGVCNDWTYMHTDLQRKFANHTEVPKMPLKKSYEGRTYRCLKKVIKKRQEERKKSKMFTTEEDKNHTKYNKFIKLTFIESRKFTKYYFIVFFLKRGPGTTNRTERRLTCPKKATRK